MYVYRVMVSRCGLAGFLFIALVARELLFRTAGSWSQQNGNCYSCRRAFQLDHRGCAWLRGSGSKFSADEFNQRGAINWQPGGIGWRD